MDLEKEYSPSSAIGGNYQPYVQQYIDRSKEAFVRVPCHRDLRYGKAERALIDYFPAPQTSTNQSPGLLVFIHGGYWQELSKNESSFLAPAWHAAGFAHAVVGYTLAPQAKLGEIVAQCRVAIAYLREQAAQLGHDPQRIVVAGSSAGGYLAAACAADASLDLLGMIPISGIFDLSPLVSTTINDALGMTVQEAAELSRKTDDCKRMPAVIAWGEIETQAFKQQSQNLAKHIAHYGQTCETLEVAGRNHFDVVHELGNPQSKLFAAAMRLFDCHA
ncbi:MAG: alpha/beta hydrolase [Burkholderiales bacterium]|nr:MAG: alpha/beta hydrolase [Burkholderiales bacterium]